MNKTRKGNTRDYQYPLLDFVSMGLTCHSRVSTVWQGDLSPGEINYLDYDQRQLTDLNSPPVQITYGLCDYNRTKGE